MASVRRLAVPWWILASFVAGCLALTLGTRTLGTPRLDASGIHLRSLGIPVGTIRYGEVESIRAQSYYEMAATGNPFRTLRVAGSCPNVVSIRTRSGWFNRIVVSRKILALSSGRSKHCRNCDHPPNVSLQLTGAPGVVGLCAWPAAHTFEW
jgi:hypothetical protein